MWKAMHAHLAVHLPHNACRAPRQVYGLRQVTQGACKTGSFVRTWSRLRAGWGESRIPSVLHRRRRLKAVAILSACWACCFSAALLPWAALCRRCALCMGKGPCRQPLVLRSAMQLRLFRSAWQHITNSCQVAVTVLGDNMVQGAPFPSTLATDHYQRKVKGWAPAGRSKQG